jgi:hypothetical protein
MIDTSNCSLTQLAVHRIGSPASDEALQLSKSTLDITDGRLQEHLFRYFLSPFQDPEFYNFTYTNGEFEMNPLFGFASALFDDSGSFHDISVKIAHHLYEVSNHPNIKPGDLFVARFTDMQVEDELVGAIGLFKAENKHSFIKVDQASDDFTLSYDEGIQVDKLDKGCLIFNTAREEGYKVCMVDKSNKLTEARYWKDIFLTLKPCNDNHHATRELLNMTRDFVKKQVPEQHEVGKADQIDMLNRSAEYFKTHESFDKQEFEQEVFDNEEVAESFRKFDDQYRTNNEVALSDQFEISSQAVKKQSKGFKSVLKLDKNFHIYIHGDRSKIEQGTDPDGRKYYKIYYDQER